MRFSLNPRDPALTAFLTAPSCLTDDLTYQRLRANRDRARAMHAPTKEHQAALEAYVCQCLRRSSATDEQPSSGGECSR